MKYRFAVPLENGVLCTHFGHCQEFAIIDAENNKITREILVTPPPHEPGLLPKWLSEHGVTNIIAGGIGQKAIELFNEREIKVSMGASSKKSAELVFDYLNNSLATGVNSCDH